MANVTEWRKNNRSLTIEFPTLNRRHQHSQHALSSAARRCPLCVKELNIEIATALLNTKAQSPAQFNELKEIVLKVHAAL
jgi:restriction endonuclease Mrr